MSQILRHTQSLCPECLEATPASLLVRDGDVWLRRHCPKHGEHEAVYWKDAELFQAMDGLVAEQPFCTTFECLDGIRCDRCLVKTDFLFVDFTSRCNLDCPICWADANTAYSSDPDLDELLERLPPLANGWGDRIRRPYVVFVGGEPTLRDDLPEAIRRVVERGYTPRISTNGIRMMKGSYMRKLFDAGLRDVLLQFDGFDEEVSRTLRGVPLGERKRKLIDRLIATGFNVELTSMVVRGVTDHKLGEWIAQLANYPNTNLSLYPASNQGRFELDGARTFMADVVEAIETRTEGRITRQDFLDTLGLLTGMRKVLPAALFNQKLRVLVMPVIFDGDDYFPAVRLLRRPSYSLRYAEHIGAITRAIPAMLASNRERSSVADRLPFLRLLIVGQFHSDVAFDLEEASSCHIGFVTRKGYIPFDIYNVAQKSRVAAWNEVERTRLPVVAGA